MKYFILFSMLLFSTFTAYAQADSTASPSIMDAPQSRPAFLLISTGFNIVNMRDFATSPLIYKGVLTYMEVSGLRIDTHREINWGLAYTFGNTTKSYNNHIAWSKVKTATLYYSRLYALPKYSGEHLNVKIGGLVNATGIFRINESLQNNAVGYELFPTLLGSIQITKDVSRRKSKERSFLFIKKVLAPRTRDLAFRLNVGIVNSSLRNGYAYSGQASVVNNSPAFDDYHYQLFSGFRMSSALNYTIALRNKNRLRMSYLWDAYTSKGTIDAFEMAHHTFAFTIEFNTNNRSL